jgi:hypothetical protein
MTFIEGWSDPIFLRLATDCEQKGCYDVISSETDQLSNLCRHAMFFFYQTFEVTSGIASMTVSLDIAQTGTI